MMKIKSLDTENIYILPLETEINIIDTKNYKEDLIQSLTSLASGKRKTSAILLDEANEIIHKFDCNFIYAASTESIDSNYQLKPKSAFNTELVEFITNNSEKFMSIEKIREGCQGLLSDQGIYQFSRILNFGLNQKLEFKVDDFNLASILQMLQIETNASYKEKFMMLYNLMMFVNRDKTNIIYIDFPVDDTVLDWIYIVKAPNTYFLIENEAIEEISTIQGNVNFIRLSNCDYKEEFDVHNEDISRLSYIFHSFVVRNIKQQSKKNIDLYRLFSDEKTTFLLKSNDTFISKTL